MQTNIPLSSKSDPRIVEAESVLRSCVHCGFCNATCPTYGLLGSELDGPRGRIYLVKTMLETGEAGAKTRLHLDRCLTCRSCETTCPSGVQYGHLADIGRSMVEKDRPLFERAYRRLMLAVLPYPKRLKPVLALARFAKPFLPSRLRKKIIPKKDALPFRKTNHARKMLVLEGCVQSLVYPNTNRAAARVLDRAGISLIPGKGCCGAMHSHMGHDPCDLIRRNIDSWWPHVEQGIEAIVMTASGCGATVKEYGTLLKSDPCYAEKAGKIASIAKDLSEIMAGEDLSPFREAGRGRKVAWQCPCTLQHGQKLSGLVDSLLEQCGFELCHVPDSHLCCGSAGTYSLLQPEISRKLLDNKLVALKAESPDIIATANVGCQMHLASGTNTPVRHWIELFDQLEE